MYIEYCICTYSGCVLYYLDISKAKPDEPEPKPEKQPSTSNTTTAPPAEIVPSDNDSNSDPQELITLSPFGSSGTSPASSIEDLAQPVQESTESSSSARAPTPPIVGILMDMGFSRAQVNIALTRSVLVGWIT